MAITDFTVLIEPMNAGVRKVDVTIKRKNGYSKIGGFVAGSNLDALDDAFQTIIQNDKEENTGISD